MNTPQTYTNEALFTFHKLNEKGQTKAEAIASAYENFLKSVYEIAFDGAAGFESREWSIVKTKLEEACFFTKKAMATQVVNQFREQ